MANTLTVCICIFAIIGVIFVTYNLGRSSSNKQNFSYTPGEQNQGFILENGAQKNQVDPSLPHPVLDYQRRASLDTHPANYGDPIRPLGIGPSPAPSDYGCSQGNCLGKAYYSGEGPYPGKPLNVPVPQGALKLSNEKYGYPFYYQRKPLSPYDYFKPYGPNQSSMQNEIVVADTPFYKKPPVNLIPGVAGTVNPGYVGAAVGYTGTGAIPFISSVDSFAPFPEVQTNWEKVGIIQTVDPDNTTIMNAYRKSIAPLQDLFEYSVQDKNGFVVPLKVNYLEDGDIIESVPGREKLGKWKFNDYIKNKWVWA